jgi:hypothetical protein
MTLLTNSGYVPPVLSAMRSCSLVERPIMKRSFLSSVSTWLGAYCTRWLNCNGVVVHGPSSLLEVYELLALLPHHACGDVVGTEGIAELSPRHLVIHGASGGVVGPPRAGVTPQLLCGEEGLLHLGVLQKPELGLHHPKPVVALKRLSCLSEERRMRSHEVVVGGRSWSGSISCPIATMGRVGNKLPQQLSLLIMGLKDRGNRLSQTWWWRRFLIPLRVLGPRVFTILSSKHVTINLEIKLSIKANLSNGKGDNPIITENNSKLCLDRTANTTFEF